MCPFREGDESRRATQSLRERFTGCLRSRTPCAPRAGSRAGRMRRGLGACGVYLGDVRPVDITLAGAYLAGGGARPGSCRTARAGGHLRVETNRFRSAGVPVG